MEGALGFSLGWGLTPGGSSRESTPGGSGRESTLGGSGRVVCVSLTAAVVGRPFLCQVGRRVAESTIPVSGRLHYVGSATLET
ncbi:hypothetical protein BHM03_00003209 [Ensete ventricosum]|nr:hypothetical protein BHM03_00003209 [Ensete ventricosum]